jgi:enamine deaminase RidA (YjgF/YER057c/UK114 family)
VKQAIEPNPRRTFAGMSQAVRIGNQIHVSGQVAFDEDGNLVGEGDPKLQAQQCFRNIEALLEAAGASAADVVKLTCYLVDGDSYPAYAEAKGKFLGTSPVAPAGTTVIVAGLLVPGLLMEVEALAVTAA